MSVNLKEAVYVCGCIAQNENLPHRCIVHDEPFRIAITKDGKTIKQD